MNFDLDVVEVLVDLASGNMIVAIEKEDHTYLILEEVMPNDEYAPSE